MLGVTFFGLQLGFILMVVAWVMMLTFLGRYPLQSATRDPFARWAQFMKGEGFPPEAQKQRKLIANMFIAALALFVIGFIAFIAAGGPDALPPPPPR
jgi:hypothetical protein